MADWIFVQQLLQPSPKRPRYPRKGMGQKRSLDCSWRLHHDQGDLSYQLPPRHPLQIMQLTERHLRGPVLLAGQGKDAATGEAAAHRRPRRHARSHPLLPGPDQESQGAGTPRELLGSRPARAVAGLRWTHPRLPGRAQDQVQADHLRHVRAHQQVEDHHRTRLLRLHFGGVLLFRVLHGVSEVLAPHHGAGSDWVRWADFRVLAHQQLPTARGAIHHHHSQDHHSGHQHPVFRTQCGHPASAGHSDRLFRCLFLILL